MQTKNKEHAEQSEAHKKRVHKKCKGNEKLVELVAYFGAQPRQRQKARGQTGNDDACDGCGCAPDDGERTGSRV